MYYVYILISQKNNFKYIGYTSDLKKRFFSHNNGLEKGYTSRHRPWKLAYYEAYTSKEDAIERERSEEHTSELQSQR